MYIWPCTIIEYFWKDMQTSNVGCPQGGHYVAGRRGERYFTEIHFISFEPYECIIHSEKNMFQNNM